ncbi:MAG: hypothetical protein J5I47_08005 [Vicingus serpentipes]|nr:hypothetical protein [Vicingus serpentipes]
MKKVKIKIATLTLIGIIFSLSVYSQQFADKEYYLVDSLILEELSVNDAKLIDSILKKYHKTKADTSQIELISFIIDGWMLG